MSEISETSKEVWREEYYGRTDFSLYRVSAALKSVVPFAFTQNTYVKVKSTQSVFSLGNLFVPEDRDTDVEMKEETDEELETLMCINSVGDMQ